jgi:hypothetical protein
MGMGGSATAVTGWITSDIPAYGYTPGVTYTITVTSPGVGKKGFEVSPQDLAGNLIGTLTAGTGNKLVGVNKYVTHSAAITTDPGVWHFQWTAPDPGVGDVTFYGSMVVTKPATKTTTLTVSQSTVGMPSKGITNLTIYPNPCKALINVGYSLKTASPVEIELFSADGKFTRTLLKENLASGSQSHQFSLDVPSGSYLIKIITEEGSTVSRVIKE